MSGLAIPLALLFLAVFCVYVYQLIVETSAISKESSDTPKEDKIIRRFVWHGYFMIAVGIVYIAAAFFQVKMNNR
jgi:hypothetical protein